MTTQPAADRDRIAEALYAHDHPSHLVPLNETGMGPAYRESADAVLAVMPAPADQAALARVRRVLETEAVVGRSALDYRGLITSALMCAEVQQPKAKPAAVEARHTCHDQKSAPGHDWECQWCSTLPDGARS